MWPLDLFLRRWVWHTLAEFRVLLFVLVTIIVTTFKTLFFILFLLPLIVIIVVIGNRCAGVRLWWCEGILW